MNAKDNDRLALISAQANALIDAGPTGSGISNLFSVVEALIGDVDRVRVNTAPVELGNLLKADAEYLASKQAAKTGRTWPAP